MCVLVVEVGGGGAGSTFSWHPIFMSLGFGWAMNSGILAYFDWDSERAVQRRKHVVYQIVAAIFVALAAIFVVLSHSGGHHEHRKRRKLGGSGLYAHKVLGIIVLCLLTVQVAVGLLKYYKKKSSGTSICQVAFCKSWTRYFCSWND